MLNVKYPSSVSAVVPDFDTRWSRAVEIDCKTKRVSMVIDDTGSIAGVIGSVGSALNGYITSRDRPDLRLLGDVVAIDDQVCPR